VAHPPDATTLQVDLVDSLRKYWSFDLDDPDNAFGDNIWARRGQVFLFDVLLALSKILEFWESGLHYSLAFTFQLLWCSLFQPQLADILPSDSSPCP
jgi:hypothetical protein